MYTSLCGVLRHLTFVCILNTVGLILNLENNARSVSRYFTQVSQTSELLIRMLHFTCRTVEKYNAPFTLMRTFSSRMATIWPAST